MTGGDFYQVEDADDLPDTFERVAENQTGVELTDTNGDGIPDVVAEMDLAMPTGEPDIVGEPLEFDPIALDTSGDGLLDNETVDINYRVHEENNETKLTAQVTYAAHHPARIDTTGDGLTDAEQIEGWEIEVVDDHDDASSMMAAVSDPNDDTNPARFFDTREVESNPLLSDTSGDGLTDVEELELGTDPRTTDTTDDGIDDADALDLDREDPTVFTTTPPEARLTHYERWSELPSASWDLGLEMPDVDGPKWYFQYAYVVEDEAGVAEYDLTREGSTIASGHPYDTYHYDVTTHESFIEGSLTTLRGSEANIYVEDVHGNSHHRLLHAEGSFYSELTDYGLASRDAGQLSGFTHGASELPEFVHLILTEPVETYEAFEAFLEEVDDELLAEMIANMPEDVREQQRLDNPHTDLNEACDAGDTQCQEYAQGWYEGYAIHFLASTAYGGTITRGVSESTGLAQRLETARHNLDDVTPTLRGGSGSKTGQVTQRLVADGGNPEIDAPAVTRHLREEHGIETAGGVKSALDTLEDLRHLEDLSSSEHAALAARLSKSSARVMIEIGRDLKQTVVLFVLAVVLFVAVTAGQRVLGSLL